MENNQGQPLVQQLADEVVGEFHEGDGAKVVDESPIAEAAEAAVEAVLEETEELAPTEETQEVEESEVEEQEVTAEAEAPATKKKSSRENERVRKVIEERNKLSAQVQEQAANLQYMYQQMQQMQQQMLNQKPAVDPTVKELLETMRSSQDYERRRREEEAEKNLPEHERLKRAWQADFVKVAKSEVSSEFKQIRDELAQIKQQRDDALKALRQRQELENIKRTGADVLEKSVFSKVNTPKLASVKDKFRDLLLTHSAAFNPDDMTKSAAEMADLMEAYHQAKLEVATKQKGQKVSNSQKVVPITTAKGGTKASAYRPSPAELSAAGYDPVNGYIRWALDGSPDIRRKSG